MLSDRRPGVDWRAGARLTLRLQYSVETGLEPTAQISALSLVLQTSSLTGRHSSGRREIQIFLKLISGGGGEDPSHSSVSQDEDEEFIQLSSLLSSLHLTPAKPGFSRNYS